MAKQLKIVGKKNAGQSVAVTIAVMEDDKEVSRGVYLMNGRGPAAEAQLLAIVAKDLGATATAPQEPQARAGAPETPAMPAAIPTVEQLVSQGIPQDVAEITVKKLTDEAAAEGKGA